MVFAPTALNHIELVHRPGERELATQLFRLFGCETWESHSGWLVAEDTVWVSEVTPEQWAFERAFDRYLTNAAHDSGVKATFLGALERTPQRFHHFGFGFRTEGQWEEAIERVEKAAVSGLLAGRVEVSSIFRPGDPGSPGDHILQAFVRTDILSNGLLALGQAFELQHYFMNDSRIPRTTPAATSLDQAGSAP